MRINNNQKNTGTHAFGFVELGAETQLLVRARKLFVHLLNPKNIIKQVNTRRRKKGGLKKCYDI